MATWQQSARAYGGLIEDVSWDSLYLRERGLKPNILDLIGKCDGSTLLDAGAGTCWLFDQINPAAAFACDIVVPKELPRAVEFSQQNVEKLSYPKESFDVIVASLLLMFCKRLDVVSDELHRVCRTGGKLVVALTHPYFYRTGDVTETGDFLLTQDLSQPKEIELNIGGKVGPLAYYYRPMPAYLNQLMKSGWRVTEVRDWFIDLDEFGGRVEQGMNSEIRRSGRIPLYSFITYGKT